jgi:hypothetical protein
VPKPAPSNSYAAKQSRHWRRQQAGESCPKSCPICARLARKAGTQTQAPAGVPAELPAPGQAELHAGMQAAEHAELPAPVPAEVPAAPAEPEHAPAPPLRESVHRALESAVVIGAGGALGWGSYSLMRGTFDAVLGADYGMGATIGLLAAEPVLGHLTAPRLMAGRRDAWTVTLTALLLSALACEVVLSFVREDVLHAKHVREAHQAAHVALHRCVLQQPPHEDMPADIASSGDRRAMRAWESGKGQRDRDWYAAQRDACAADAAGERQQQQGEADALVTAADTHSPAEPYLFALLALVMGGATIAAGGAVSPLLRALLDIPSGIVAAFTRLFRRKPLASGQGGST